MHIQENIFAPKRYLIIRKTIPMSEVANKDMYDEAGKKLGAYIQEHEVEVIGPWSVLYFTWDMEHQTTDMGIAFPVAGVEAVQGSELTLVDVPESPIATALYEGSYEHMKEPHRALMAYMREKGYTKGKGPVMAMEEYVVGPMDDLNTAHWKTQISYFHA